MHEHLHYGRMAAVSVMCMRTGSYTHIIALIKISVSHNLKGGAFYWVLQKCE